MFWENYLRLCNSVNKAPNVVAAEVGIKSSGTVTGWKNGVTPRDSVLSKLSNYFGVSVDELVGIEKRPTISHGTAIKSSGRHNISGDALEVAFAYDDASPELQAAVCRVLGLNLDIDVPLAAHGGPSGKISAKTAEALEKGNDLDDFSLSDEP